MSHVLRPTARPTGRLWAVLLFAGLLVWAASPRPALAQSAAVIDANARIHVVVANEAQLTGDYDVDGAGNITMLYINQVHVQGLTPAQAASVIRGEPANGASKATGLSQFYVRPQVVVTIASAGGIGVDVTGLVSAPRHYTIRSNAHLDDVLQQAVPALNADLSKVEITHGDTRNKETVDYRSYLDDKTETGNPVLQNGDVINIQSREPQPIVVNVQGQAGKPGRFEVPANTTAYTALQNAGGLTPLANPSAVVIQHSGSVDKVPFSYAQAGQNPTDNTINPVLQDGDTIIVPAAPVAQSYTLTGPGIRNPSEYALPDGRPVTLAQAIGRAGGLSDRAQLKAVQIIRTSLKGGTQTIKLDATDPSVQGSYLIQPGDNITINQGGPPTRVDPFQILGVALALFGIFHH